MTFDIARNAHKKRRKLANRRDLCIMTYKQREEWQGFEIRVKANFAPF